MGSNIPVWRFGSTGPMYMDSLYCPRWVGVVISQCTCTVFHCHRCAYLIVIRLIETDNLCCHRYVDLVVIDLMRMDNFCCCQQCIMHSAKAETLPLEGVFAVEFPLSHLCLDSSLSCINNKSALWLRCSYRPVTELHQRNALALSNAVQC